MAIQPFIGPWPLLQFSNLFYTDGRTPWTGDQPVARSLIIHRTTQTQNKRTHKHPCLSVRLEATIPAFERAKTVHALDRSATVIGFHSTTIVNIKKETVFADFEVLSHLSGVAKENPRQHRVTLANQDSNHVTHKYSSVAVTSAARVKYVKSIQSLCRNILKPRAFQHF
jgi:hypothetical protein